MSFRAVRLWASMALMAMLLARVAFAQGVAPPATNTPPPAIPRLPPHYPSEQELLPVWMSLLQMREGEVYRVGPPANPALLDQPRDTTGIIAGCPILESAHVGPGGAWLDSLSTILARPSSYRREAQMQLMAPRIVIRLRGEEDSLEVTVGPDFFLRVTNSSGIGMVGWLDRDSGKLAALIDAAFLPPSKRSRKGTPKTAGAHKVKG